MTDQPAEAPLTIPDFHPPEIHAADAFFGPLTGRTPDVEGATVVEAGLNAADLAYVFLAIGPAVDAGLAIDDEDPWLARSVWIDLAPPEARLLAERLRVCAEAAARFERAALEAPTATPAAEDQL